jgi:hypothetical protein
MIRVTVEDLETGDKESAEIARTGRGRMNHACGPTREMAQLAAFAKRMSCMGRYALHRYVRGRKCVRCGAIRRMYR